MMCTEDEIIKGVFEPKNLEEGIQEGTLDPHKVAAIRSLGNRRGRWPKMVQ